MDTIASQIRYRASIHPGRAAVIDHDGSTTTYAQLERRGDELAYALLARGLRHGDRVAAWLADGPEYVALYVACAFAGFVVVPVHARYTASEAHHLIEDSCARALVFDATVADRVSELDETTVALALLGPELEAVASAAPLPAPAPDDLFVLGYTSGTTGRPKGAMLTHRSVTAIARLNAISYRLPVGSIAAMTGSMSFVAVVPAHVFSHFQVGGTVVFLGKWDVDSLSHAIARTKATFTYVPTPLLQEFTQSVAKYPDRWRTVLTVLHSASKADPDKLRAFAEASGNRLVEGWGMTENSGGLAAVTVPADIDRGDFGTVGRAAVETAIRLAGDLPHDGETVGELLIRSPALASGYWNRPEDTASSFRNGWYHSGDLGSIDPGGHVRIAERRTDLIVSGGMNVYPSEVERVIAADRRVAACAVVGVPHERWGQTVAAAVVCVPGATLGEQDVIDHCRRHLAGYKKPTKVVFLDALPTTPSLKVSRAAVRDLIAGAARKP
ncbi:AMP-binding protein [Saccharomonospora sp. NPDC046836]|uniref:class I adenylate-forming enzyme family protein n=1 Tax=Saccharomonospora sp. NPDC046836 TaxID=3156921 RepID=UPI0033CA2354